MVFIDESGLLMAPLVKRSWAPEGHPPVLHCKGGHREKVSVAGALWWSPPRRRLGFVFQTLRDDYFNNAKVGPFLDNLLRELPTRLVIVWDRGNMHKGDPIRVRLERFPSRLSLEQLPSYAPMLNPVEWVWSWLKYVQLCNFTPQDCRQLNQEVVRRLKTIADDQELLINAWHGSDLPVPRTLLMS